jgi:membrane-associated phospholipid phosphatase
MRLRVVVVLAAAAVTDPRLAGAQTPMPHDSVHAAKTLFTSRDALLAAGFVGLTVAMLPVDKSVALRLQNPTEQANRFFQNAATDVRILGDPGAVIIGVSMYGVGKVAGWKDVADFGFHTTEAIAVAGITTTFLKGVAGRARPFVSSDTNPGQFHFGRGFNKGSLQSFPSGHATAAFALASTVTSESQRWWPHQTWIVGPVMYTAATLVGLSRMYNNQHWASDVALGAAIGTFSGIKIVRYSHGHSANPVDRFFLGASVQRGANGDAQLGLTVPF